MDVDPFTHVSRRDHRRGCGRLLVAGAVSAPAAEARTRKPAPVIAAANGTVGIAEAVNVVAPTLTNQTVTLLFSLNGTSIVQQPVALNAQGNGSIQMTPARTQRASSST